MNERALIASIDQKLQAALNSLAGVSRHDDKIAYLVETSERAVKDAKSELQALYRETR